MHPIKLNRHKRFFNTKSKSVDKEAYLAEQLRLKQEAEQNGTLKKYVKTTNSPIEE